MLHQRAEHSEECRRVRGEQRDQLLQQVQRELSVRSGYSAGWEAGVWPECHAPCSKLARVETIWVMMTDSTVDSGLTESTVWSKDRIWLGLDS